MMVLDRAQGALLGLAVGDALGTTLEFAECDGPPFPQMAVGPHRQITGGGPFDVLPGQVTDDTQMACCLAASLHESGRFDVRDVARRYVAWMSAAFDIGSLTRSSLCAVARLAPEEDPREAGRRVWVSSGRESAGNGSLMRTAPIGVALASQPEARRAASLADSAVTHFDPRCQLACAALNAAISAAVVDRPNEMHDAASTEIERAAADLTRSNPEESEAIDAARSALAIDLDLARRPDPDLYGPELHLERQQGFVRVAFRLAFWELAHATSIEQALIDVVNRGGDADTNAAITGALMGARYGASAIPQEWRNRVLDPEAAPAGDLRELYHPARLLELVGG
jgi:ADP-ribosylglycohydrolase